MCNCIIPIVSLSKFSCPYLTSVAEQAEFSSETPKTGFSSRQSSYYFVVFCLQFRLGHGEKEEHSKVKVKPVLSKYLYVYG